MIAEIYEVNLNEKADSQARERLDTVNDSIRSGKMINKSLPINNILLQTQLALSANAAAIIATVDKQSKSPGPTQMKNELK